MRWFFGRQQIRDGSRHKTSLQPDGNYTLAIFKIRERDLGNYSCNAANMVGEGVAFLTISGKMRMTIFNSKL